MRERIPFRRSRAAGWARLAGGLSLPVLVLAALGSRGGFVPGEALVPLLVLGFGLAFLALALGVLALVRIWSSGAEGAVAAISGIVYALPALLLLGAVAAAAIVYPKLNDVSTDPDDPPAFADGREPAPDLQAEERAALQARAYPDLAAHEYDLPIGSVYAAALDLVKARGWTPTRQMPPLGGAERADTAMLEATAPTLVFHFQDEVVLRFREVSGATVVDMRSVSATGTHDLGQNARRIRSFLADLDLALQPPPGGVAPAPAPAGGPPAAVSTGE
jgi:hypothetical protein